MNFEGYGLQLMKIRNPVLIMGIFIEMNKKRFVVQKCPDCRSQVRRVGWQVKFIYN